MRHTAGVSPPVVGCYSEREFDARLVSRPRPELHRIYIVECIALRVINNCVVVMVFTEVGVTELVAVKDLHLC